MDFAISMSQVAGQLLARPSRDAVASVADQAEVVRGGVRDDCVIAGFLQLHTLEDMWH